MYERMHEKLGKISGGVKTYWGEMVWPTRCIPEILQLAVDNQWIILGGDILDMAQNYTYDNWYYNPDAQMPLDSNVLASVKKAEEYISQYQKRNGDNFLISLTLSNNYVAGNMTSTGDS